MKQTEHINIAVIDGSGHAKCQLCGTVGELRPYGPNGESVCFPCGMKDEAAAKRAFGAILEGNHIIVIK